MSTPRGRRWWRRRRDRGAGAMLDPAGHLEGPPVGEDEGGDDGMVADAVKPLLHLGLGNPRRCVADLDEILAPGRRAPAPGEDVGHPDAMARGPPRLPWYQHPDGHVAGTLAQLAVMEDDRPDGDRAEPQRNPQQSQDRPDHVGRPSDPSEGSSADRFVISATTGSSRATRGSRSPSSTLLSRCTDGGDPVIWDGCPHPIRMIGLRRLPLAAGSPVRPSRGPAHLRARACSTSARSSK